MIFQEKHIDFNRISDEEFEELCFDLLLKMNYHDLIWRQGGSDSGRDIEAKFTISNPFVDAYEEEWFIECKKYKRGVNNSVLASKIDWAFAEKPDNLLIIVSSHLTNSTRKWLEKRCKDAPFKCFILEGKQLVRKLIDFPELIQRYFLDKYGKLLQDVIQTWTVTGVFPTPEVLFILRQNLDFEKLDRNEIAFLWSADLATNDAISDWIEIEEEENEFFSFECLIPRLKVLADSDSDILSMENLICSPESAYGICKRHEQFKLFSISAKVEIRKNDKKHKGIYSFAQALDTSETLEVLILQGGNLESSIRHIYKNTRTEVEVFLFLSEATKRCIKGAKGEVPSENDNSGV